MGDCMCMLMFPCLGDLVFFVCSLDCEGFGKVLNLEVYDRTVRTVIPCRVPP